MRGEAAVAEILKLDPLLAPDKFHGAHGRPARLGFALLELVNRALTQTDVSTELTLAPAKHGTREPNLGSKSMPLEPASLADPAELRWQMNRH